MKRLRCLYVCPLLLFLVLATNTCMTDQREAVFEPSTIDALEPQAIEGAGPRPVVELLRAAEDAFNAANKAQERGDEEAALRKYTLMLELLIEADLDPAVFYDLRTDFARILDASVQRADLIEEHRLRDRIERKPPEREIAMDLGIPFPLPERVLKEIDAIQNVYPKSFQAGLDRSCQYLPFIEDEFARAGLPTDLAWLAMVESQFCSHAVSHAGAGGMWQFMKSTGQLYGLQRDGWFVDERFNWQKATRAACAYLTDLHELFDGSWPLAVSAYNMGEKGLERAIAANGGERDLWTLIETPPASYHIRRETKRFYPKLLASIIVAKNPERYGFKSNHCEPELVARVPVTGCYELAELNKACGLPKGTLRRLNPDLIRRVTPPSGTYHVAVPAEVEPTFLAAVEKAPKYTLTAGGAHTVRRGETLSEIADRYRVSVRDIIRVNQVSSPRRLQIGQKLMIPGKGSSQQWTDARGRQVYKVHWGDTLSTIAKAHNVRIAQLQAWNNLGSTRIRAGDTLVVGWEAQPAEVSPAKVHVVRAGEYPAKIAHNYGVRLDDFLKWNNLTRRSTIHVGDRLVVRASDITLASGSTKSPKLDTPPPNAAQIVHRVVPGENPTTIAAKYGVKTSDFLAWNGLTPRSTLHIGDVYTVYVPDGQSEGASPAPGQKETQPDLQMADARAGARIVHVVSKGQNPTTIARRYGVKLSDLFEWNDWKKPPLLQIGSTVVVYRQD